MLLLINFSMCQIFGDYLWYFLNMVWSFRIFLNWYFFIFITVTFVLNIIVTRKIYYSYWFMIIFFFFMIIKILNIWEILSIFNCFSFFNLKRFLKSLIIFSSSSFKLSIITYYEKINFFKQKMKLCYVPFKSIRKYYL